MDKKIINDVHCKLWDLMLSKIRHKVEVEGVTRTAIAERIGLTQPTVSRWLKDERGDEIELRQVLAIIINLGVSMDELARSVGEKNIAEILAYFLEHKDTCDKYAAIIQQSPEGQKKIEAEIDYTYSQIGK